MSRAQKSETISTSEAEYVGLGDVVKELLFLRQMSHLMLRGTGMPYFPVFEDNEGAVKLAQNPVTNSNSKQIAVRHQVFRELVYQGDFQ